MNSSSDTLGPDHDEKPHADHVAKITDEHSCCSSQKHAEEEDIAPATREVDKKETRQIITMTLSDPEHPNNWSMRKKTFVVSSGILTVIHSTLGSSLPGNAVPYIAASFGVTDELQMVLPISTFLMVCCGPDRVTQLGRYRLEGFMLTLTGLCGSSIRLWAIVRTFWS